MTKRSSSATARPVKLAEGKNPDRQAVGLKELLASAGADVRTVRRARFKNTIEMVISIERKKGTKSIQEALEKRRKSKNSEIVDWHLE